MREPLWKTRPGEPYVATFGSQRINDFIHLSEGFSNSFLITTEEGRIVINTGHFHEAPYHKANYDAITTAPTRYIILTQGHVDHVGGVDHFREPGTQVIAHAGNAEHQAYDKRLARFRGARSAFAFRKKIGDAVERARKDFGELPAQAVPIPDITFEDRYEFGLGGLRVELIGVPGAETNDSLVVWLPEHRICFPGNLFGCLFGHFPNLVTIRGDRYRDALTVAKAVQTVMDLDPELLLVGHHQPVEGAGVIQEELARLRDAILYVHDETVAGMNAGKDLHTLLDEIRLPPGLEVGEGYGKVSWGVQAIWENYAGWFHHESTTELYSVPQREIHGDLIDLAGGSDAIVERARARFEAGEPEAALHLLDILLSRPEPVPAAVDLAIGIHRFLESRSTNFWLTAWLRDQVERLEARRSDQAEPGRGE
ncbi:MAG TPA: MBL fold metallo-hydrolase [Deltaproteobacteria bacterium]|nr:MBL fold metallo-hydrolase [Deltaproteobacteria bacterium]